MLGGKPTPGVGFAMGVERVLEVMRECGFNEETTDTEFYVLHSGGETQEYAMLVGEMLRDGGYEVIVHAGEGSFKNQMKKADQSGATFALICGEDECANRKITVKRMYGPEGERFMQQETLDLNDAITYFLDIDNAFLDEE